MFNITNKELISQKINSWKNKHLNNGLKNKDRKCMNSLGLRFNKIRYLFSCLEGIYLIG